MEFVLGPRIIRSSAVPRHLLRGMIGMGFGKQPAPELYDAMSTWAWQYGGDVIIELDATDAAALKIKNLRRLHFVAPR